MPRNHIPICTAAAVLGLSLLACRPVFAIGWSELIILLVLITFLFGPILFRLARSWQTYQESKKKNQDK
jgi:hypothetical protein